MAVYTDITTEEIAEFVEAYGLGPLRFAKGIAEGVENSNYLLGIGQKNDAQENDSQKNYILTLYEKRVQAADLPFFMEVTERLADAGTPVPRPLHTTTGEVIRTLKAKPAALIEFLPGNSVRDITAEHTRMLGSMLARLHQAAQSVERTRANALSLAGWQDLAQKIGPRADDIAPGLYHTIAQELAFLQTHWPAEFSLPHGVIHADAFPDNVFFDRDANGTLTLSGVIDWYFACNDWLAYDLAVTMNAWCFEGAAHQFAPPKAKALFAAYHSARPLSDVEIAALPILARGAALRFLLTRAYDWLNPVAGALVRPKDPLEYWAKLRFHQNVTDANLYLTAT